MGDGQARSGTALILPQVLRLRRALRSRPFMIALRWLASLSLLAVALSLMDWRQLGSALLSFSPWIAALIVLLNLAEFPLLGYRWHLLSRKVVPLSLLAQLGRYFASQFFNTFTPGQLGGDVYRFVTLRKSAITKGQLAAIIAQERLIGLSGYLAVFLIGAATFEMSGGLASLSTAVREGFRTIQILLLAAFVMIMALPICLKVVEYIFLKLGVQIHQTFGNNLHLAAKVWQADRLVSVAIMTVVGILGWCLTIWLVASDLQVAISIPAILIIGTLSELIRVIPITVQGLGLREGTFAAAFALSGHSPESGFVVGTIAYAALTIATLLIGLFGLAAVRGVEDRLESRL